jgi:Zinc-binding dehydrogenase
MFQVAFLRPGETLLVHGGSSGIGTMAIQLAKAVGARVAVTAGSPDKLEARRTLGADILINYREQDFVQALGDHSADVILDVIGAKYLDRNLDALNTNGRLVTIGMQDGSKAELNLGKLMTQRATIAATGLRARPLEEKAAIIAAVREHVWPLIDTGRVKPIIDSVLPIEATPKPTTSWNPAPTSAKSCSNSEPQCSRDPRGWPGEVRPATLAPMPTVWPSASGRRCIINRCGASRRQRSSPSVSRMELSMCRSSCGESRPSLRRRRGLATVCRSVQFT